MLALKKRLAQLVAARLYALRGQFALLAAEVADRVTRVIGATVGETVRLGLRTAVEHAPVRSCQTPYRGYDSWAAHDAREDDFERHLAEQYDADPFEVDGDPFDDDPDTAGYRDALPRNRASPATAPNRPSAELTQLRCIPESARRAGLLALTTAVIALLPFGVVAALGTAAALVGVLLT